MNAKHAFTRLGLSLALPLLLSSNSGPGPCRA